MNIRINDRIDKKASMAIFVQFAILMMQYLILNFFRIEGSQLGTLIKLMSKITVGMFFLIAFRRVFLQEYKLIIITYIISIIIFLSNMLLFPNNIENIKSIIFDFFFMCLPCFFYSYSINKYDILYKAYEQVSNIVFIIGLLTVILNFLNKINVGAYSMTLSYYLLMPALFYLYKFLNEISTKYFLLFLISLISIALLGARGPILCIGVYTIIYLINSLRGKNSVKKMLFYVISIIMLIILMIFFKNILYIINQILESFSIYSRTIVLLLRDEVHLSGRENLYSDAFDLIKEHPALGIGIAGDRYFLGAYVHNLFLEVIMNFGSIIGMILSLLLIGIFIKSSFFINKEIANFVSILLCLGVVPLMISGSYLSSTWFWIYIGISIKYIFKTNKKSYKKTLAELSVPKDNIVQQAKKVTLNDIVTTAGTKTQQNEIRSEV